MTNHWIDIRNADCILIIGSNAAENHPISFKWVTAAMERPENPAKLIHVDPRFSRTSSKADLFVRMRSGTDIAFMGGMINYLLKDMRLHPGNYNIEYVQQYTNAAYIVNSGIKLPGDDPAPGFFSGWAGNKYDPATWKYASMASATAEAKLLTPNWEGWTSRAEDDETAWAEMNDHCVLKLLWKQYRRYDEETVSRITGVPVDTLREVYAEYAKTGARGKAGTIMYAMGATQHTYGTQNIRAYSIVQLLLANMGVAGGGINALRGTSNVQGSTDMGLLSHILPGYVKVPNDGDTDTTLAGYLGRITPAPTLPPSELAADNPVNWWQHTPKYVASMLKAWWPGADPEVSYGYLPKGKASGVNYTHLGLIEAMGNGNIDGLWVWGQNPASGGPNSNAAREALGQLKWLVVSDVWMNETAEFWKRPGVDPGDIDTEVFVLPAAASFEKQGSVSNSGRWVQWRYRAVLPPGEAAPDLDIMSRLMKKIQELYEEEGGAYPDPVLKLDWPYGDEVDPDFVAREINGYALEAFTVGVRTYQAGELIDWFGDLQSNGKTSSGNWLFCNQYTAATAKDKADYPELITVVQKDAGTAAIESINKAKKRNNVDTSLNEVGLHANWSWCWPRNRRIIYNRASVDLNGAPWDADHPVLRWTGTGWDPAGDIIDGGGDPINVAADTKKNLPFIMNSEGVGKLWGYGLKDGPIPEAYEAWESPISNIMSPQQTDPAAFIGSFMNDRGDAAQYPYVATTYRCTEHWQTGIMTRNLPWLSEIVPEMYVELGEDLAGELRIQAGDRVRVSSARGDIKCVAVVTRRFQGIRVDGQTVHQVGVLWHWGYSGRVRGDSGNILTPHVGDANTTIPEYKTFLCNVEKLTGKEAADV
jgi:formate dehydrogenase major subunit